MRLFKLSLLVIFSFPLMLVACMDDFEEINRNPTNIDEVEPDPLFTRALVYGTLRYDVYQRGKHLYANLYAQYFANTQQGWGTDRYETRNGWLTAYWNAAYANIAILLQEVMEKTEDEPDLQTKHAQAKIWKVWVLHRVTDYWGDVPYSEALKGREGEFNPTYDAQEDIYNDMLNTLEVAVDELSEDVVHRYGDADVLFRDDLEKWRRFANSLRLRLAMRVSEVDPQLAQEHIDDVLSRPVMSDNSHSAKIEMGVEDSGSNLVHVHPMSVIYGFNEYRVSELVVDKLSELDDPRLSEYVNQNPFGQYRGFPNGLSDSDLGSEDYLQFQFSRESERFRSEDTPVRIQIYPEVEFLKAEAALRGWHTNSPEDHLEQGIRASVQMYDIESEKEDDYVAAILDSWEEAENDEQRLEIIIEQKWIALFSQGMEAYAELRRTGYPEIYQIPEEGETGGELPRRIKYPESEYGRNPEGLNKALDRQGEDHMLTRIWWDTES